jgi:hypothetical protein
MIDFFELNNVQKTIFFISIVNGALGKVHVNFDAERRDQALRTSDCQQIYDLGFSWSETFQSSSNFVDIIDIGNFGRRFSFNLVIGNGAYGLNPNFRSLEKMARSLENRHDGIKLGVEGIKFGRRAIDLASEIGATAYILHTDNLREHLRYAASKKVPAFVYTLMRISESTQSAVSEVGNYKAGYFRRRGIESEEIPKRIRDFAVYGTRDEVANQICELFDLGASKVVLSPVFNGIRDMTNQIRELGHIVA